MSIDQRFRTWRIAQPRAAPGKPYYRMNTRRAVRQILGLAGFLEDEFLMVEPEPAI